MKPLEPPDLYHLRAAVVAITKVCLVYTLSGGQGTVTLPPGRYSAVRLDPRDGTTADLGSASGGTVGFSLPEGDWVLIYRRKADQHEAKSKELTL